MRRATILLLLLPSACRVHVTGLMPLSPSPEHGGVDSLTPTLQWEPFATQGDARITEVVYDVRVMLPGGGVVYLKEGLPACEHRVESPLRPKTRYEWTVRARFRWEGQRRVTQWSELARDQDRTPSTPLPAHPYLPLATPSAP